VESAIDGFSVCIFAYGQTGAGKTHTLIGGSEDTDKGILSRSCENIFERKSFLESCGWKATLTASFSEHYNDLLYDLLDNNQNKRPIKEMQHSQVTDFDHLVSMINTARSNRTVGSTMANSQSSRSHAIFHFQFESERPRGDKVSQSNGSLTIVDLAGSERLNQSQVQGAMLDETVSINKSLTTLGDVINSLAKRDNHIPYRNSKLTFLLKDFLGSDSKTLLLINIDPASKSYGQTLNSLNFGANAKRVFQKGANTAKGRQHARSKVNASTISRTESTTDNKQYQAQYNRDFRSRIQSGMISRLRGSPVRSNQGIGRGQNPYFPNGDSRTVANSRQELMPPIESPGNGFNTPLTRSRHKLVFKDPTENMTDEEIIRRSGIKQEQIEIMTSQQRRAIIMRERSRLKNEAYSNAMSGKEPLIMDEEKIPSNTSQIGSNTDNAPSQRTGNNQQMDEETIPQKEIESHPISQENLLEGQTEGRNEYSNEQSWGNRNHNEFRHPRGDYRGEYRGNYRGDSYNEGYQGYQRGNNGRNYYNDGYQNEYRGRGGNRYNDYNGRYNNTRGAYRGGYNADQLDYNQQQQFSTPQHNPTPQYSNQRGYQNTAPQQSYNSSNTHLDSNYNHQQDAKKEIPNVGVSEFQAQKPQHFVQQNVQQAQKYSAGQDPSFGVENLQVGQNMYSENKLNAPQTQAPEITSLVQGHSFTQDQLKQPISQQVLQNRDPQNSHMMREENHEPTQMLSHNKQRGEQEQYSQFQQQRGSSQQRGSYLQHQALQSRESYNSGGESEDQGSRNQQPTNEMRHAFVPQKQNSEQFQNVRQHDGAVKYQQQKNLVEANNIPQNSQDLHSPSRGSASQIIGEGSRGQVGYSRDGRFNPESQPPLNTLRDSSYQGRGQNVKQIFSQPVLASVYTNASSHQNIQQSVPQNLHQSTPQNTHNDVPQQNVPTTRVQNTHQTQNMPQTIHQYIPQNIPQNLSNTCQNMPQNTAPVGTHNLYQQHSNDGNFRHQGMNEGDKTVDQVNFGVVQNNELNSFQNQRGGYQDQKQQYQGEGGGNARDSQEFRGPQSFNNNQNPSNLQHQQITSSNVYSHHQSQQGFPDQQMSFQRASNSQQSQNMQQSYQPRYQHQYQTQNQPIYQNTPQFTQNSELNPNITAKKPSELTLLPTPTPKAQNNTPGEDLDLLRASLLGSTENKQSNS